MPVRVKMGPTVGAALAGDSGQRTAGVNDDVERLCGGARADICCKVAKSVQIAMHRHASWISGAPVRNENAPAAASRVGTFKVQSRHGRCGLGRHQACVGRHTMRRRHTLRHPCYFNFPEVLLRSIEKMVAR